MEPKELTMPERQSAFYGFLHEQVQRLIEDFSRVATESQLDAVRHKWLASPIGILENLRSDPYYAAGNENERKVFDDYIRAVIELETRYFKI